MVPTGIAEKSTLKLRWAILTYNIILLSGKFGLLSKVMSGTT